MRKASRLRWVGCSLAIIAFTATSVAQTVRHVPQDFPTIQAAINASANGDSVLVSAGRYTENINFNGKAITVQSQSGADATVIDGGQAGSTVTFSSGEGSGSMLTGFTVRNGNNQFEGSGIKIENASPTITNNKIVENTGCDGLGIAVGFGSPLIQTNIISNNTIRSCSGGNGGGGILLRGAGSALILGNAITGNSGGDGGGGGISMNGAGTPTIRSNVITGNAASAPAGGGGIQMFNLSDADIVQNVIASNSSPQGGGLYWLVVSGQRGPLLVNNTIAGNDSASGSAIFGDGFQSQATMVNNLIIGKSGQTAVFCGNFNNTVPPVFSFNDVFSAGGTAYAGICTDQTGTNGNISADPQFADGANGDYLLVSASPAIDAGTNSAPLLPPKDIDGDNRIINGTGKPAAIVDMGVDEFSTTEVLALSNSSLTFAPQSTGTSSAAQTFTFTNNGAAIANISAVMSAGDFSQVNTCGASLAPSANCNVSVTFTPTASGQRNGVVAIMTDASESPQAVFLSGTGGPLPPVLVVVPH